MSTANGEKLDCFVWVRIKEAWVEEDAPHISKLCVRYSEDTGAENLGCFRNTDRIVASEFVGLSVTDACSKFNRIVYPNVLLDQP